MRKEITEQEREAFSPMEKIGLIACLNEEGKPHIAFLSSLMAQDAIRMTMGEFVRGRSKEYLQVNPKAAFCIQTLQGFQIWQGRILWRDKKTEGKELEAYKKMPMHRYNSYFPVHTVHYFDLEEIDGPVSFPIGKMIAPALKSWLFRGAVKAKGTPKALNDYSLNLFQTFAGLRFISFIGKDGWPRLVPCPQCQAAGRGKLVLPKGPFYSQLKEIPDGADVAVFSLKTSLENVLVRGVFHGFRPLGPGRAATADIEWVYNSMPPAANRIFPPLPLVPVREF